MTNMKELDLSVSKEYYDLEEKVFKERIINGGENIVEEENKSLLKELYNKYEDSRKKILKEYNEIVNNEDGKQRGGAVGGLTLIFVILKLIMMTIGTYIFNYFPIVFIISIICLYMEYRLTTIMGQDIVGMPMLYMIFACCCPCCWTCFRLFKGWTNTLNISTEGLFSIMSNCSSPMTILDIHEVDGNVCKDSGCYITSKECHSVLYPRG